MSSIATGPGVPSPASLKGAALLELATERRRAKKDVVKRFEAVLTSFEIVLDGLIGTLAIWGAYVWVAWRSPWPHRSTAQELAIAASSATLCVLMLDREGAYRSGNSLLRVRETERVLRVCVQMFVVAAALIKFTGWSLSFESLCIATLALGCCLLCEKQLVYWVVRSLHLRGVGVRRVLLVGAGYTGRRVFSALARSPKIGWKPVAVFDKNPALNGARVYESSYKRDRWLNVETNQLTLDRLRGSGADMVLVAVPSISQEEFVRLMNISAECKVKFGFVPSRHVPSDFWTEYSDVDGLLLTHFGMPASRMLYQICKRLFDFCFSAAALIAILPLWIVLVLWIRKDSPGPALFRQERIGLDGHSFELFKFRTMHLAAEPYDYSPRVSDDSRITRFGRFLRRTSLDELPQLLNVLRGEMSLVGPRPEMPFIVEQYLPLHRQRLQVKPGITGLWQISADRAFLIHENIEYDLYYIRNRGFFMDLAILLHTAFFAMRGI